MPANPYAIFNRMMAGSVNGGGKMLTSIPKKISTTQIANPISTFNLPQDVSENNAENMNFDIPIVTPLPLPIIIDIHAPNPRPRELYDVWYRHLVLYFQKGSFGYILGNLTTKNQDLLGQLLDKNGYDKNAPDVELFMRSYPDLYNTIYKTDLKNIVNHFAATEKIDDLHYKKNSIVLGVNQQIEDFFPGVIIKEI